MKKGFILIGTMIFLASSVYAGITLRYYNKDSNDHEWKVKTCGSTKTVEFDKSKTASVTIQTGCSDAVIYTDCGEVTVKDGDNITIKDGCIKIN